MWALYSLLSAFTWASSDACAKRAMQRGVDEPRIMFLRHVLAAVVLLPVLSAGIPSLDRTFWLLHLPWIPLEITAMYLYMRAIRVSPLSLTLPFLALTPAFLVLVGWVILGETVGPSGFGGIVLVMAGSYVVTHSRHVIFQMAEVPMPRELLARILDRIQRFGVPPPLVQRG